MYNRREINLEMHYPDFIKDFKEFTHIAFEENQELDTLYDKCADLWNDGFIQTAGSQGIKKWESLLGIKADQKLSIQERRDCVLSEWNNQLPYTEEKLREKLTALLNDDYILSIVNQEYKLELIIKERTQAVANSIKNTVNRMIPANLITDFFSMYQNNYNVRVQYENAIHFRTGFYPRYNLAFLDLDNTWKLDGRLLNSYDGDSRLDFYPVSLRIQAPVREQVETGQRLKLFSGAREDISLNTEYKIQTEARASPETAEQFTIKTAVKEQSGAGPVRVMNLNVLDNEWTLNDSRKLNGGLTIL